jgi:hypothetical protein
MAIPLEEVRVGGFYVGKDGNCGRSTPLIEPRRTSKRRTSR